MRPENLLLCVHKPRSSEDVRAAQLVETLITDFGDRVEFSFKVDECAPWPPTEDTKGWPYPQLFVNGELRLGLRPIQSYVESLRAEVLSLT